MSFAAALLGTQGSFRGRVPSKPAKTEVFGCQFTGVIVLDNSTLKPYGKISGQLAIDSGWPIQHYGIRVQLEAQCTLKFETKLDGRVSFHKKYDNILEACEEKDSCSPYQASPVMTDVVPYKVLEGNYDKYELPPGNHRYRFSLTMRSESLPAPFKSSYGSLKYKLVAYMCGYEWVQVAEKEMRFLGFHNLSQNIDALKPIELERSVKKSIFSSKKKVTAVLKLESCGYLPAEDLPFTLSINNPKCIPLKMWITLNQRCVYNIDGARKTTVALLGSVYNEVTEPGTEYAWVGSLNIHKAAAPSYSIHPMYSTSHVLQFKVKVDDYNTIRGEVPITIGTTRDPVELLAISANLLSVVDERFPARRRGSTSSTHSDCSGLTQFSLPPAYSQLSSRAPSNETLPPPYFEECLNVEKREQRRHSSAFLEFRVIPPNEASEDCSPQTGDVTPASSPVTDD